MARLSVAVRTYGNGDYVLSWQRIEEICMIPHHRNDIYGNTRFGLMAILCLAVRVYGNVF